MNHQKRTRSSKSNDVFPDDKKPKPINRLVQLGVDRQIAEDWLSVRKVKRQPLTDTAIAKLEREANKAGITVSRAVQICAEKGWAGFGASWDWQDTISENKFAGAI